MTTNTSNKSPDAKTIDVRGLFCPEPVFRYKDRNRKIGDRRYAQNSSR